MHRWRRALRNQFAVAGEPREPMRSRDPGERSRCAAALSAPEPRTSTSRPASVAVTWMSSGLLAPSSASRDRARGRERAVERGRQHRAGVDRHDVMRARRGKADLEHAARAAPGMERGAAAAVAVGVDQRVDRRVDAGLPQRRDDQAALPFAIGRGGASAASRSRRKCRNAGRSARCARRSRARPGAEPPVGIARAGRRPRRSRPAAHRARETGPAGVSAMPSPR